MRALDVLHAADTVYCEDTRVAQKLLSVFGLHKKLERCDEHMEKRRVDAILDGISKGKIFAFISDAGTPGISDPGASLAKACHQAGALVSPVAGPSAAIAAVSVAGLESATPFTFLGFLPSKSGARRKVFQQWRDMPSALVLYEASQRVADCLEDAHAICGDRTVLVARELSKLHETLYHGAISDLMPHVTKSDFKGEVVIVIYPATADQQTVLWDETRIDATLTELMATMSNKEAVAQVTAQSGLSRKIVYARALALGK